jgi:hypothetical protein
MGKLVLGVVTLALSAASASAADLAAPGYGYGAPAYAAPGYGYAAPALAPAQGVTTIVIVTPAPAYTAPPVTTGYYAPHPVPPEPIPGPIYDYAPGYGYDYTPGYWNRGYWGHYGYGWR